MNGNALAGLQNSINLANQTAQSWNALWTATINPAAPLWLALVHLGLILAGLSLMYLVVTTGREVLEKQSWSELVQMFVWPLVIVFFLGSSGKLLADVVVGIRQIGYTQVTNVLTLQANGAALGQAIRSTGLTGVAQQSIQAQYSACAGLTGTELNDCWQSATTQAQAIINEAESKAGTSLPELRSYVADLANAANLAGNAQARNQALGPVGTVFNAALVGMIQVILSAMQWCFVNLLEVALLLTALFAPVAMGLSLLPLQGRPIVTWLIGYVSLFGVQLGYNIIVGLTAAVINQAGAVTASDIGFLLFLALFAPLLATAIAGGGGQIDLELVSEDKIS
jgi:hypothetical protein